MRLYLDAKSEKGIGYIPDWICITYNDNGYPVDLTLDIQGWIDYDRDRLFSRCKGELVPWTLIHTKNNDEIDLSEMSEEEIEEKYPDEKLFEIFTKGYNFVVGIYPADDSDYDDSDFLEKGIGTVEFNLSDDSLHRVDFEFDVKGG